MDTTNYINRRIVYLACLGIDVYILALYLAQSAMVTGGLFIVDLIPGLAGYADFLDGLIILSSVALGVILLCLYIHEMHDDGLMFYGRKPWTVISERHKRFGFARCICFAALMFALQIISMIVLDCTEIVFNIFGYTVSQSPAMNADYSGSLLMILYVILIGPAAEELVFRGFLLKALAPLGRVYAIVVSALMFSLMHADIQQIFFAFIAGLIFAYIASEYSVYASLLLHIINNAVYGELLTYLAECMPQGLFTVISVVLSVGSIIISVVMIVRNRAGIKAYINGHRSVQGAYGALKNRWFIAYAVCMIALTCQTVTRI